MPFAVHRRLRSHRHLTANRTGSCQDIGQSLRRSPPPRRKPCGHNATPPAVPRCRRRAQRVLGGRRGPASPRQRNAHAARLLPQLPIAEILPGRSRGVLCPDMTPSASSARGWFSRASGRVRPDPLPQTTLALPPMPYRPSPAVGWQAAKPDPPRACLIFCASGVFSGQLPSPAGAPSAP